MKCLATGNFFGQTNKTIDLQGITLTDTEYTYPRVEWHYHENAYFTFLLTGQMIEGNKKEQLYCPPGTLLFHNWQEPHYNIKPAGYTRGFHVEIGRSWFDGFSFCDKQIQGSININDPDIKLLFYYLYKESKQADDAAGISIQAILLQVFSSLLREQEAAHYKKPAWVTKAKELLRNSRTTKITLAQMAAELNIHPVHLSRDFSRYFHCTLGDYIRKIKIEHSLTLLFNSELSLTEIAFECGFADQSHFIRCFRSITHTTPLRYKKSLFKQGFNASC